MKCLFYLHNYIEPNHYAISHLIKGLKLQGCQFNILAKRVIKSPLYDFLSIDDVITLDNMVIYEKVWNKYDLIHVVYDGIPSIAICNLALTYGIKYILSFHGGYDTNHKIFLDEVINKTADVANSAKVVTVPCQADHEKLLKIGCHSSNIELTPPPIDFKIVPKHLIKKRKRIVVVGRFIEKKGIDTAIIGFSMLPEEYRLDIVGDGELRGELIGLANKLGVNDRINWHGIISLEKTLKLISQNEILWHPAKKAHDGNAEGIPQVLLYALAARSYIITTDTGNIGELIKHNHNGIIVKSDNPMELKNVTINMENHIINNSVVTIEEYSIEKQLEKWKLLYNISS